MARIDELFAIDAQARTDHLDQAARHALRLERARPLLDTIPSSRSKQRVPMLCLRARWEKAASYTLALWRKLTRFLEYPELELSN